MLSIQSRLKPLTGRRPALMLCLLMLGLTVSCGKSSSASTDSNTTIRSSGKALSATEGKVFALLNPGESAASARQFAGMSSVDGLAYRERWSRLEPRTGIYDWHTLDSVADIAREAGKQLSIHIAADTPDWLAGAGMQSYSFRHPFLGFGTAPVPWDSSFLSRHALFIRALAAHVRARGDASLVLLVSVGAPVSEMSLLGCSNGMLGNSLAYDRARYLSAWVTSITAHENAFSAADFDHIRLVVSAPVSQICHPDKDGKAFFSAIMDKVRTADSRLGVFMADLNALGSARLNQLDANLRPQVPLHFQTIWSYNNDPRDRFKGPLRDALCYGWNQGARYVEIYRADLLSPADADMQAIASARTGAGC